MPFKVADHADDGSLAVPFLRLGLSLTKPNNHLKTAFMRTAPMNLRDAAKPSQPKERSAAYAVSGFSARTSQEIRGASVSREMCRSRFLSLRPSQVRVALSE